MQILPDIQKRTYSDPSQTLPKCWWEGTLPRTFYEATITLVTKPVKGTTKKRKLQAHIFNKYRYKSSQQNISKLNHITHKEDHTPQKSEFHPKFTRMVKHTQINQCDIPHHKRQKSHGHLNRCIKSISSNSTLVHDKTLTKVGIEETYLKIIKAIDDKPTDNIILNVEKLKAFTLKPNIRQGRTVFSPFFFNIILQDLDTAIRK